MLRFGVISLASICTLKDCITVTEIFKKNSVIHIAIDNIEKAKDHTVYSLLDSSDDNDEHRHEHRHVVYVGIADGIEHNKQVETKGENGHEETGAK